MTHRLLIAAVAVLSVAVRAETDDMDQLAAQPGQTMNQCMACHATFKAR